MQQQQISTLTATLSKVLADLAFLFTDDELIEFSAGDLWIETTVSYHGPVGGTLKFVCTRNFAVMLTGNLLGVDLDDEDDAAEAQATAEDAVKEFMNVVCGQFVTATHGTDDVFNLTIPEVLALPETPDFDTQDTDETATLSVEGHRVRLVYLPEETSAV